MSEPLRIQTPAYMFVDDLINATCQAVDMMRPGEAAEYYAEKLEAAARTIRKKCRGSEKRAAVCRDEATKANAVNAKRNLLEVVDKIIAVLDVPKTNCPQWSIQLRHDLAAWRDGLFIILPEDESRHWRDVAGILHKNLEKVSDHPEVKPITDIWFELAAWKGCNSERQT